MITPHDPTLHIVEQRLSLQNLRLIGALRRVAAEPA